MTWKGTLRSLEAAARRAERESQRRQRELDRQHRELLKMQEQEQAAYELQVYENHIELLKSVHTECGDPWDWEAINGEEEPEPPVRIRAQEDIAAARLEHFMPSLFDKLFRRVGSRRTGLTRAIEQAKGRDEAEYAAALGDYADWQETRALAARILSSEEGAYLEAIEETDPFADINELGSSISFHVVDKSIIEATLHVNDEQVVPKEIKTLLRSGKLSVKAMPKTAFYELYQDYICNCALRVAREILALLPVRIVIVSAMGNLLNTRTGYMEEQPILSVAIPRETMAGLNLEMIDPSDAMDNFLDHSDLKRTSGFRSVEKIDFSTLQQTG